MDDRHQSITVTNRLLQRLSLPEYQCSWMQIATATKTPRLSPTLKQICTIQTLDNPAVSSVRRT